MIDALDEQLLRQAIAVAVKAVIVGDAPTAHSWQQRRARC